MDETAQRCGLRDPEWHLANIRWSLPPDTIPDTDSAHKNHEISQDNMFTQKARRAATLKMVSSSPVALIASPGRIPPRVGARLVEEAEHLPARVLPLGLLVVHDAVRRGQDNVTELARRQQ
eukprot:1929634-Prymnesium_polylepis.1